MMTLDVKRCGVLWLVLVLSVFSGALFLGCSDEDNEDILPDLILSTNSLEFGEIVVDTSSVLVLTVRNLSNDAITVDRVTITDTAFEIGGYYYYTTGQLVELEVPFTIAETEAKPLYVRFTPIEAKAYTGTLVIESKDADLNIEKDLVDLSGTGVTPPEI